MMNIVLDDVLNIVDVGRLKSRKIIRDRIAVVMSYSLSASRQMHEKEDLLVTMLATD